MSNQTSNYWTLKGQSWGAFSIASFLGETIMLNAVITPMRAQELFDDIHSASFLYKIIDCAGLEGVTKAEKSQFQEGVALAISKFLEVMAQRKASG